MDAAAFALFVSRDLLTLTAIKSVRWMDASLSSFVRDSLLDRMFAEKEGGTRQV